jgi:hypothetical protein
VSFRDQKTLLGLGEAQVRNENSVANVPEFLSTIYAYLHLAAIRAGIHSDAIPVPKWYNHRYDKRATTRLMISLFRAELWGRALGVNKSDFVACNKPMLNPLKMLNSPVPAVIYASR